MEAMTGRDAYQERVDRNDWKPRNVVWELTLRCNLRCRHCGSNAGKARAGEMSTQECLSVVDQLASLGAELITLSGGEPTLRPDWDVIGAAIAKRGIYSNMVTNGAYGGPDTARDVARRMKDAGMCNVGVSIDGPEAVHEEMRGKGTFARTMKTIETLSAEGVRVGMMTTVHRLNFGLLESMREMVLSSGATMWRFQLGKPMGSMCENSELALSPRQMLELVPRIARLKKQGGVHVAVGDSIGYFGPHDKVLRGWGWRNRAECWRGCQAGMHALGIEADGGVKGCLSLQAKCEGRDPFVEGNLRESALADLWYRPGIFGFNRDFEMGMLTGFCKRCGYARMCRGGARCVSSAFTGFLGEDPYCWHRVHTMEEALSGRAVGRMAASAAAAVVMSLGLGCGGGDDKGDADTTQQETVAPDTKTDAQPDLCCPEYGIPPDTVQPEVRPDYGIPPDVKPDVKPEYGIPPDVVTDADADAIDCSKVCCMCEYGIIPEEVWEKCCGMDAIPQPDSKDVVTPPEVVPDYGIPPDVKPEVAPEYGIPVDVKPEVAPEYGIPVDVKPEAAPDYGIPPDVVADTPADAIDCSKVCCMCEYGIIPEEVWKECCDPCKDACCDCDYGEPPPPQCCPK